MRFVAAALVLWSAGAIASPPPQVHTGTNTNRDTAQPVSGIGVLPVTGTEVQPTDEAVATGRKMAKCVVSQRPNDVKVALRTTTSEAFDKAVDRFDGTLGDCMIYGGKKLADAAHFEFARSALAGLLAEALLARDGMPMLAPAKYDANAPKLDWIAGSQASLVQLRLGECLAQTQPAPVSTLVRSTPGSPQEASAFQALVPAIPACLDKNVTLKATRSSLRLALALALYRRSIAPATAGASVK
jgi:hypothetical protein